MKTIIKFKRNMGITPATSAYKLHTERAYSLVLFNGKLRFITTDNVRVVAL